MLKLVVTFLFFVFQFQSVHCKIEKHKKLRHAVTKGKRAPLPPITLAPGTLLNYKREAFIEEPDHRKFQFKIEFPISAKENTFFARNTKDGTPVKVKLYGNRGYTGLAGRDRDFGPHLIIDWHEYMKTVDLFVNIGVTDWYLNNEKGFPYMKIIQTFDENHFLALNKDKLPYDLKIFKTVDECNAAIKPEDEDAKCFQEGTQYEDGETMPGCILVKRKHIQNYKIVGFIAEGAFGGVYTGISEKTGKPCAIKVFKPSEKQQASYDEEVKSFEKVKGLENVAQMVDHFKSDIGFVVVVEYYNLGDLMHVLFTLNDQLADRISKGTKKIGQYSYSDRVLCDTIHILMDTEAGLQSMHEKLMSHTDLKPENVLVRGPRNTIEGIDADFLEPSKFTAAMGDLGLVEEGNAANAKKEKDKFIKIQKESHVQTPKPVAFGGLRGSEPYLPPERKASYPVSSKDVWALGVMIRDDIMKTIQPRNDDNQKRRYKMGLEYIQTTSAYEKVADAGGLFYKSKCADTLSSIMEKTRSVSPWSRPTDTDLILALKKGYEDGVRITTAWDEMMNREAVALVDVSKRESGGMAGGLFKFSNKRNMFFTPFLNEIAYNEIFNCDKAEPLQPDTPYIVISSESSKKRTGPWTCYPVRTVEKSPSDNFKFTVESTIPTLKKYIIDLTNAKCTGTGSVKGVCRVLGTSFNMAQKSWRTHIVDHVLTGGGRDDSRVSASSSTISDSEVPIGGEDISMRPASVDQPKDEANAREPYAGIACSADNACMAGQQCVDSKCVQMR